jgi:hypothetical protein
MSKPLTPTDPTPSIQDLYPKLTPEEQAEAEEALTQYAALLVRMVERRAAEREWTVRDSDGTRNSKGADMGR